MARYSISDVLVFGLTILSCFTNVGAQYVDPNDDPFYAVPVNVGSHAEGTVIRNRSVITPGQTAGVKKSYQLLYRTINQQGNPTATVATLWVPAIPQPSPKILLYSAAYDSLNIDCAPSWLFVNSSASRAASYIDIEAFTLVPWAMANGFYVLNTDAEGPTAALLVGKIEGNAAIDGVKAVMNFTGIVNPSVALYGFSGGAHTSIWAANIANGKPSLPFTIVGAAFGGTPVDLGATYNLLDNTNQSALAAAAIFGIGNGYPNANTTITSLLTPLGKQVSMNIRRRGNCIPSQIPNNNDGVPQSIESMFTKGPRGIPLFESIIKNESLTSDASPYNIPVPTFPRLEYHGDMDTTVPYQPELDYVNQQCKTGNAKIWFQTFKGLDHGTTGIAGLIGALAFVGNALNGFNQTPPYCGAPTTIFPTPGSTNATAVLGEALSRQFCNMCACCSPSN